jgi:hypothetical protein
MTTTVKEPYSKYAPSYDYTNPHGWSMTPEEKKELLEKAAECHEKGDYEGYEYWSMKLPLAPNIALQMRDDYGKEALIKEGYNLGDAEIAYGKDWLDNYKIESK